MKRLASLAFAAAVFVPVAAHAEGAQPTAHPTAKVAKAHAARKVKPSYFLASDPHVPLAIVDGEKFVDVQGRKKGCGAPRRWAKPKSRWNAIGEWGQILTKYAIAGSELYDVTGCREVTFAPATTNEKESKNAKASSAAPDPGTILVSDDSGYVPPKSAEWTPSESEKKRFEKLLGTIEGEFVDGKPVGDELPAASRIKFFETPELASTSYEEGKDSAIAKLPRRWAVAGGPVLVVAYLGAKGHWKVANVKRPLGMKDSYKPIAVFDMNGDGTPEIVYRSSDGPSFFDSVLRLQGTTEWIDAATSPGGATL